jgi:hypothetical protein
MSCNITSLSLIVAMGMSRNCTVVFPLLATPSLWSSMKTSPDQDRGERSTSVVSKVKMVLLLPANIEPTTLPVTLTYAWGNYDGIRMEFINCIFWFLHFPWTE